MFDDEMKVIKQLAKEMEQCLEIPVEVIPDEEDGYVTIACNGETIIVDYADCVPCPLEDMLWGMRLYKRMKERNENDA